MGMDVYGKREGSYFRRSVWGWHPLWEAIVAADKEVGEPIISDEVAKSCYTNDGSGLGAYQCVRLCEKIQTALSTTYFEAYFEKCAAHVASLPRVKCGICDGTGHRVAPPNSGAGDMPCNGCDTKGDKPAWDTHYNADVDDVKEFTKFMAESGGFEVH